MGGLYRTLTYTRSLRSETLRNGTMETAKPGNDYAADILAH
jgi:hypothetical protein